MKISRASHIICQSVFLLSVCMFSGDLFAASTDRVVYAIWSSRLSEEDVYYSNVHQFAAMPLEYLGLRVEYVNVDEPLPKLAANDGVRGLLLWDLGDYSQEEKDKLLEYFLEAQNLNKRTVTIGSSLWIEYPETSPYFNKAKQYWENLGLSYRNNWVTSTYLSTWEFEDHEVVNFERPYEGMLSPFPVMKQISNQIEPHLTFYDPKSYRNDIAVLVSSSPRGGYIAGDYAVYTRAFKEKEVRKWYVNPFAFFRKCFATDELPKFDIAMRTGRRLYYSHIDGDGWNNVSEVAADNRERVISAKIIFEQMLRAHPELPCTVAPIAADLDTGWVAVKTSGTVAEEIFSLPHIEVASHTYSHPYEWKFFERYEPRKEIPYLNDYFFETWRDKPKLWDEVVKTLSANEKQTALSIIPDKELTPTYNLDIPRAFANYFFDINQEIGGSIQKIEQFSHGTTVALLQWSGDCQPFPKALELVKEQNIPQINGGDSRFDGEFPSFAWVAPLYRTAGGYVQPYASMSNENTYTNLWTERFFAQRHVRSTWKNTGFPYLLRPINLYYHMYSGERYASLEALKENIAYVKEHATHPIKTSEFAQSILDLSSIHLVENGKSFSVSDRGNLQTLRFDFCADKGVDFSRSSGVVGQKHLHGSLYVHLDPAEAEAEVALKELSLLQEEPSENFIYLVDSNWDMYDSTMSSKEISFFSNGFGKAEYTFCVPLEGEYEVLVNGKAYEDSFFSKENVLSLQLDIQPLLAQEIKVRKK